jgi:chemotaxis protein methyltransferase CheR
VTPAEYDYLRSFLKVRSGLVLSGEKQYLIEGRLLPVARRAGVGTIASLVAKLKDPREAVLAEAVVEAMTTNESFFFRDKTPFEHLSRTMLPELIAQRGDRKRLRIWCAAAATGQEPYSIAMCLSDLLPRLSGWRIEIVGTDISNEVLEKAKGGVYTQFEVQRGLPIQRLLKHFSQVGESWHIAPELRDMVEWRKLNLLENFASLGRFDIVFCRNVLIYFDHATKVDVFDRLSRQVMPDGFLVLGAAETVVGLTDAFKPLADKRGVYVPNRPTARPLALVGGSAA